MIRGLYTATTGMTAQMLKQEVVTNNLSNSSTPGYKQDVPVVASFKELALARRGMHVAWPMGAASIGTTPIGPYGTGTVLDTIQLDLKQGELQETGEPCDLALTGSGLFAVQTLDGTGYTRNGRFTRDSEGHLVTVDGGLLLGLDGPIQIPEGDFLVREDGTIEVNSQQVGQIRVVDFGPDATLVKTGNNLLQPADPTAEPAPPTEYAVNQGYLESSNVDAIKTMVDMISAMRAYQASQRLIQMQDDTLARAVNEVGKI